MFGALIIIVIASAVILGAVCGVFYMTEGRIPRPLFDIFFASLWPSKGEDIGTIIADSIDADEDCSRWSTAGYREVFSSTRPPIYGSVRCLERPCTTRWFRHRELWRHRDCVDLGRPSTLQVYQGLEGAKGAGGRKGGNQEGRRGSQYGSGHSEEAVP
jgi:hypothetical protein